MVVSKNVVWVLTNTGGAPIVIEYGALVEWTKQRLAELGLPVSGVRNWRQAIAELTKLGYIHNMVNLKGVAS